ncbi:MAG: hypothetical protein LQ352_000817 [Teloschistes flavicans]|nr:MAG: hypothetical protein LQ352_000817 [Teloschistes flavicans]
MSDTKTSAPHDRDVRDRSFDYDDDRSSSSSHEQTGVKHIEAISQTWTRWSLITAYLGLLHDDNKLDVVQGVVNAVIKPPMAKIANAFGRLEAFCIGVFLYIVGYIQMAASNNVRTFASAQIFYSAGFTGLQILQQIFIADTSDLLNRALFSSLPDLPFLVTVWVVQNDSITAAGHITQTFSFTSTVSSIITSLLIKYTRHYKYFVTAGAAIYLMGVGLIVHYREQSSSTAQIVGTQIAIGIGGGMLNVPAQLGVQASVSHGEVAAATAVFLTIVEIGGAVGSAISGAVWTANIPKKLALYLPADAQADAALIFGNLTMAKSYPRGGPERIAIDRSYQETMKILLIIAVCLAVPLLPLSLVLQNYKLDQMDQKVKGRVIGRSQRSDSETLVDAPEENGQGLQTSEKGN